MTKVRADFSSPGMCFVFGCRSPVVHVWIVSGDRVWWSCLAHEPAVPAVGPLDEDGLTAFEVLSS